MRTWQRTVANTKCGNCPTVIAKGAPVQAVTIPGVKRVSFRCEACAGESVGPIVAVPSGFTQIARMRLEKALPFDYKTAQMARDPGEDD